MTTAFLGTVLPSYSKPQWEPELALISQWQALNLIHSVFRPVSHGEGKEAGSHSTGLLCYSACSGVLTPSLLGGPVIPGKGGLSGWLRMQ